MELRPGERALMSSLSAVAEGNEPDTPPLLADLEMWGYAVGTPPVLTAIGMDVLSELHERIRATEERSR